MSKKLYIKTYGCQMNVYDSARMADVMAPLGYAASDTLEDADLVVLNTCHIREKAAEKVYSELGRIHKLQRKKAGRGKRMLLAVAGCVGQAEGEEITRRMPFVDMVLGPQSYHRLPEMVNTVLHREGINVIDLKFEGNDKFDALPEESAAQGVSTLLSIQEGCDKFCTFCVVPYTRGAEYSRPVAAIMREAIRQVSLGSREIILLGQNVNAYHGEDVDGGVATLAGLIRQLAGIEKLERIRYTTSHPRDMSDALIAVHGEEAKLMPALHLPIQSGSDRILKMMNRRHTVSEYLAIIEKLKKVRPDIALSSDFIVGFPGETDEDFDNTMRMVEQVGYTQAYSFTYSPRPGTPAAGEEQLPDDVKEERLKRLQALLNAQQEEFNRRSVGQVMPVLFEREGKLPGQLIGKTPYLQSVHVTDSAIRIGDVVNIRVTRALGHSVAGELQRDGLLSQAA